MIRRSSNGYMLNEMILIIAMLSILMLLSVEPVRQFFRTVLGTEKAFGQQQAINILLDETQRHVEQAALAWVQAGDERLGGDLLYLAGPEGVRCYQFADGAVTLTAAGQSREWSLPQARFTWRLLTLDGGGQAVAMTTWQTHKKRIDALPVFRQTRVCVVNLASTIQTQEDN